MPDQKKRNLEKRIWRNRRNYYQRSWEAVMAHRGAESAFNAWQKAEDELFMEEQNA